MQSTIVDRKKNAALLELRDAYWTLYTDKWRCWDSQELPSLAVLKSGKYTNAVICKEGTEVLGALLLRGDEVYYPVIKEGADFVAVLRSMIECAYAYTGHLHAQTTNELILETAMNMGIGAVTRNGNHIEWV